MRVYISPLANFLHVNKLMHVLFHRRGYSGADKGERGSARECVLAVQQIQGRRSGAVCRRQHLARLQRGERVFPSGRVRRGHGDRACRVRGQAEVHGVGCGGRSEEHHVHHAVWRVQTVHLRVRRQHTHLSVEN